MEIPSSRLVAWSPCWLMVWCDWEMVSTVVPTACTILFEGGCKHSVKPNLFKTWQISSCQTPLGKWEVGVHFTGDVAAMCRAFFWLNVYWSLKPVACCCSLSPCDKTGVVFVCGDLRINNAFQLALRAFTSNLKSCQQTLVVVNGLDTCLG